MLFEDFLRNSSGVQVKVILRDLSIHTL
jgi:hypothetical protein